MSVKTQVSPTPIGGEISITIPRVTSSSKKRLIISQNYIPASGFLRHATASGLYEIDEGLSESSPKKTNHQNSGDDNEFDGSRHLTISQLEKSRVKKRTHMPLNEEVLEAAY